MSDNNSEPQRPGGKGMPDLPGGPSRSNTITTLLIIAIVVYLAYSMGTSLTSRAQATDVLPTNQFVESSFWNFDALFQPQSHPARDAQDTFFISDPASTLTVPEDYLQDVAKIHSEGGFGSFGYGYQWDRREAMKNILRTHTTAVSTKELYKAAKNPEGFKPMKCFSIDRVFRNETMDATHLAEFHQVELFVADRNLNLGHLIGMINDFFAKTIWK